MLMLWPLLFACSSSPDATTADTTPSATDTLSDTAATSTADTGSTSLSETGDTGPVDPFVPCPPGATPPYAETRSGCVLGREAEGVEGFLGIPYAEAPVAELRWRRPVPVTPWTTPLEALEPGEVCIQTNGTVDLDLLAGEGSEDCLFLNVLRPAGTQPGDDLPVLFFVHGGGHSDGAGSQETYLGTSFARPVSDPPRIPEVTALAQEAVVITINYRLAQLGWVAHPGLSAEDPDGVSGNQGLWDALLALRWAHDNVEAFGGDPDRLTLFGESAGSVMSCGLLASPASDGLFSSVILQSGLCTSTKHTLDQASVGSESGYEQGERLVDALGCTGGSDADEVDCLRSRSAEEVMSVMTSRQGFIGDGEGYTPVVDGVLLPEPPAERFAKGAIQPVPVVLGVNEDEGTLFATLLPIPTPGLLDLTLRSTAATLGWNADELVEMYDPVHYDDDVFLAWSAFLTDSSFVCPSRAAGDLLAPHTDVRTYYFRTDSWLLPGLGASHGFELPFVFGTGMVRAEDQTLSDRMVEGWASVAAGEPAMEPLGPWPLFGGSAGDGGTWLQLDHTVDVITGVRQSQCDWMDDQG